MAKRQEFNLLSAAEKKPWVAKAKSRRTAAFGQISPLDGLLSSQAECEVSGGPWGLAASQGNLPSEWPLSRASVTQATDREKLHKTAEAWERQQSCVWGEAADFPRTVYTECPCYEGECVHDLTPSQEHSFKSLRTLIRLALRHHGLGPGQPLCFEFRSASDTLFALVGDNAWSHCLQCDFLRLQRLADCEGYLLHLGIAKEEDEEDVKFGWPQIESETAFLLRLLSTSDNPWMLYCLQTVLDQMSTYLAVGRTVMDPDELREKEATRLELAHAMLLFKKVTEPKKDEKLKKFDRRHRGRGRGRGHGRGRGRGHGRDRGRGHGEEPAGSQAVPDQDPESASGQETSETESSGFVDDEAVSDQEAQNEPPVVVGGAEDPPPPPGLPAAGRQKASEPWGTGSWDIAPIKRKSDGVVTGCGAHCRGHLDQGATLVCKKAVTFGKSGLSYDILRLRIKRWLVAGLDDAEWPLDAMRSEHVGMGGVYLCEFEEGLSEEDCDRIANAQVAAG